MLIFLISGRSASRYILLFLIWNAFISDFFAQNNLLNTIGVKQGLSQQSVWTILRDSKGFMWLGTLDGLNRYNGYGIEVFKNNPADSNSLSNNIILSLLEDNHENLWIGTSGGGLNAYNINDNHFIRYQTFNSSLLSNKVNFLFQSANGTLWIGTAKGLNIIDSSSHTIKKHPAIIDKKDITFIYEDKKRENIWLVAYKYGLIRYNYASSDIRYYPEFSSGASSFPKNSENITSLYELANNLLLIGTDGAGLLFFDTEQKKIIHHLSSENSILKNRVSSIITDKNNRILVATKNGGLYIYDPETNSVTPFISSTISGEQIIPDNIRSLYSDAFNNLWIGTQSDGAIISHHIPQKLSLIASTETNKHLFKENSTLSILKDTGNVVWIGSNGNGLIKYHINTRIVEPIKNIKAGQGNSVLALAKDGDEIWAGTWGAGISVYNTKTKKSVTYDDSNSDLKGLTVMCFLNDSDKIWIGTFGEGLYYYEKTSKKFFNYNINNGLSSNNIISIVRGNKKELLLGTHDAGFSIFQTDIKRFKHYKRDDTKKSTLNSNLICHIYQQPNGIIWLATSGGGLTQFNPATEQYQSYTEKDGLPNDVVYAILPDKNNGLWLSTNKGISYLKQSTTATTTPEFKNLNESDGLQGWEFNQGAYFLSDDGTMFFGGINGINFFNPEKIQINTHAPEVYITSFKKFQKEVELDTNIINKKYIELSWQDNFSFDFVGLDYYMPARNKYMVKLDGVDKEWSLPTDRRYVSYNQLRGGDYLLRIKACNSDGIWNEQETQLHIRIIPPFWETPLFYILVITGLIIIMVAFSQYRTRKIKNEKIILEKRVAERTSELAEKNKEITDSIRYAQRIQKALLTSDTLFKKSQKEYFVLYKPKDIVSGDFYWAALIGEQFILCAADCTGHGVPGAFMSLLNISFLNEAVNEKKIDNPSSILEHVRARVMQALVEDIGGGKDGMDCIISSFNLKTNELRFACANNPLWILRNGTIIEFKPDKFPVGKHDGDLRPFTLQTFNLQTGDLLYLFTDGYADQFGGPSGKKFKYKQLQQLITKNAYLPMNEQEKMFNRVFEEWKGSLEQVDDILLIGVRI